MATQFSITIFFYFFFLGFLSSSLAQNHTLTTSLPIKDWQSLVSPTGIFKLGFFTTDFPNRYLGIWYSGDGPINPVWIANRNNPIGDSTGELTIDSNGKLQIIYNGGEPIVLYSGKDQATSNNGNVTAILLDTGNFVLREINGTNEQVLWESFDYPTDTLLPGMKLGINFKTGHKWSLNSWLTGSLPVNGAFTVGGDPNGTTQLIIWRRGVVYWTSGEWGSNRSFEVPELKSDEVYNLNYVTNKDEKYFTYSLTNTSSSSGIFARWVMDNFGQFRKYEATLKASAVSWSFNFPFGQIGPCFGNPINSNVSYGCVWEWEEASWNECGSSKVQIPPKTGNVTDRAVLYEVNNSSLSLFGDCIYMCMQNCSCLAYANSNGNGTGCLFWSGDVSINEYADGLQIHLLRQDNKNKKWPWFLIPIAVAVVLVMLLMGLCYLRRGRNLKLKEEREKVQEDELLLVELETNAANDEFKNGSRELEFYSFESIVTATNNFSSENKLGQGGFGPVYKGNLLRGQEIAVKRLSRNSGQGLVEFRNEITLIAKLQHTNLVRLLGCCVRGEEKMLIYEYLPNKSLDFFLFDPTKKKLLDWKKRFSIIEGIAQGLLYLHKYSRLRVIHRDLKASNILLDEKMNPKISDFGMARIFGANESEANTNRVVGTYGYMSPEYAMEGIFSEKSDVFSFGVLLLEILSGKKNNSLYDFDHPVILTGYAWELWREGCSLELMDPTLDSSCPKNQVLRCIHVGLLCVQENSMDRPTMSDVVSMLADETMPVPSPKRPAFSSGRSAADSKNCSINHVTLSTVVGR